MHSYKDPVLLCKIHLWLAAHVCMSSSGLFSPGRFFDSISKISGTISTCHEVPFKKISHFSFHIVHVLLCFSPVVTRDNAALSECYHCSIIAFMKTTAANLFVWTEEMFTNRGMNSSTLNDRFQPPHWRDWSFWPDMFDLLSFYCV